MSEYQQFVKEREQIDFFLQNGYQIEFVSENLNGAIVQFFKNNKVTGERLRKTLHIQTANARKYFSVKLIQQHREKNRNKGDL